MHDMINISIQYRGSDSRLRVVCEQFASASSDSEAQDTTTKREEWLSYRCRNPSSRRSLVRARALTV
jgi:hypothetical protein